MSRKIMWELDLSEVMTLRCCVDDTEPDPDERNPWADDVRKLISRVENEFPELPYAIDPKGYLKEKLEQEFLAWADSLPDIRKEGIELAPPPRDITEYML